LIYLDSSAIVKLAHAEVHSDALRDWLDARIDVGWTSSVLAEIETFRALARYASSDVSRLAPVLDQIELLPLGRRTRMRAQAIQPMTVRSLDAIHIATALGRGARITAFVGYDGRMNAAAKAAGLPVNTPGIDAALAPSQ